VYVTEAIRPTDLTSATIAEDAVRPPTNGRGMFVSGPRIDTHYTGMTIPYAEAIERARTIAPVAQRNIARAEQMRRMPEDTIKAILDSGLMPLMRPKMFGGFEGDWITCIDCVSEVGRFCGSTGWVMTFLLQHQVYLSLLPEEAQRYVYERQPDPMVATSFAPTGQMKEVPGGLEVSGRWKFGSASDYCSWAIVGGIVKSADGTVKKYNVLLKPEQFTIDRTWNSVGLRGTGSNDMVVEPTFVPYSFTYLQSDAIAGRAPGMRLHHESLLYRTPFIVNGGFAVMTPMHGIARGFYESFVGYLAKKAGGIVGKTAELAHVQAAIGESKAEIDLAYLLTEKLSAATFGGEPVDRADAIRTRRDFAMVLKLLMSSADRLFSYSGANGLDESLPLQRHWRDLHAISHHAQWQVPTLQNAGKDALGLLPQTGDAFAFE
jgi:3-hydroxy-9,10-secoandrosta-1,3,5(10)-triene-9,17-dione monooxygenase